VALALIHFLKKCDLPEQNWYDEHNMRSNNCGRKQNQVYAGFQNSTLRNVVNGIISLYNILIDVISQSYREILKHISCENHQFIKSHDKRTCLQLHEYKHNTNMIQCRSMKSKKKYVNQNQTVNEQ